MAQESLELLITAQTQDVLSGLGKVEDKLEGVEEGLKGASSASKGATAGFGGLGKVLGVAAAGLAGVAAAAALVGKGLANAGIKEQGEVQFKTLLGSADAAHARMKELADFANSTPFANDQVINMSKTLQAMTNGALASGDGLRMVGDTAAALSPDELERFTLHIGRMYSQIQNGQAFGESLKELGEMGAISGDVAIELKKMQEAGESSEVIWAKVAEQLNKNKGAMADLSQTFSGSLSTLIGTFNDVLADAFRPISDALTPVIADMSAGLEKLRPGLVSIGEKIGSIITGIRDSVIFIFNAFKAGDLSALVSTSLKLAGATFINYLFGGMKFIFDSLAAIVEGVFSNSADPKFWAGMLDVFQGVGLIIRGVASLLIGATLESGQKWYGLLAGAAMTAGQILKAGAQVSGLAFLHVINRAAALIISIGRRLKLPGMEDLQDEVVTFGRGVIATANEGKAFLKNGIPDAFKENKATATGMFEAVGGALKTGGKEMIAEGMEIAGRGSKIVGNGVADTIGESLDGIKFSPADIVDTEGLKGDMDNLIGKHWPKEVKKSEEETKKAAEATGASIKEAVNPDAVVSSLAKIGGGGNIFVAAAEAAQQTSSAAGSSGVTSGATAGSAGVSPSGGTGAGSGVTSGAVAGSAGVSGGASVGGSAGNGALNSIDRKMSQVVSLLSGQGGQGAGGLTVTVA